MAHFRRFMNWHRAVYEWTDGRIGANLLGIDMVLMYTLGRKSGRVIATPVACYPEADGVWVHASNNGQDQPPAWWLNLQAQPEIDIRLGRERYRVRAEEAPEANYERLWQHFAERNPPIRGYREKTRRRIPIVLLRFLERY